MQQQIMRLSMIHKLMRFSIGMAMLLLFSGAISSYGQNASVIELQPVLTIGEDDKAELYQWAGVCTDDLGNIYLTDMMDNAIKKFTIRGEFVVSKKFPNAEVSDVKALRLIGIFQHLLYVTDQNRPGLICLDSNLNYRKSIHYSKPVGDFLICSDNLMYVSPLAINGFIGIDAIDSTGKVLTSLKTASSGKGGIHDLFSFTMDYLGDWYLCYRFKDRIARLTSTAQVIWERQYYPGQKSETSKILFFTVPKTVFYMDLAMDSHDHLFILLGHLAKNPNRDLLVLDRSGNQIASLTLEDTTHLIHIDKEDHLFVRAQKGTVLKKYKICYRQH